MVTKWIPTLKALLLSYHVTYLLSEVPGDSLPAVFVEEVAALESLSE